MIEAFILRAKQACYVGGGAKSTASRPAAHDLTFQDGDLNYRDSYFGGTDFIGQEVVWQANRAIWAMNYHGRILRDDLLTAVQGGMVIKAALSAMYGQGRFLGGFRYQTQGFAYADHSDGDWQAFTGIEHIFAGGTLAYQLNYHGGLIRD